MIAIVAVNHFHVLYSGKISRNPEAAVAAEILDLPSLVKLKNEHHVSVINACR